MVRKAGVLSASAQQGRQVARRTSRRLNGRNARSRRVEEGQATQKGQATERSRRVEKG